MSDLTQYEWWTEEDERRSVSAELKKQEFDFALALVTARFERKLTQTQLAQKAGLKQAAIARLESGRSNPRFDTLAKVAKVLDKKIALV